MLGRNPQSSKNGICIVVAAPGKAGEIYCAEQRLWDAGYAKVRDGDLTSS